MRVLLVRQPSESLTICNVFARCSALLVPLLVGHSVVHVQHDTQSHDHALEAHHRGFGRDIRWRILGLEGLWTYTEMSVSFWLVFTVTPLRWGETPASHSHETPCRWREPNRSTLRTYDVANGESCVQERSGTCLLGVSSDVGRDPGELDGHSGEDGVHEVDASKQAALVGFR